MGTSRSRFEQRVRAHMANVEFAAGYREMEAELDLLQAIEDARTRLDVSKEELARRMGRRRESVSRVLTVGEANPTLDTITELLTALGVTADITLRKAGEGEGPVRIAVAL